VKKPAATTLGWRLRKGDWAIFTLGEFPDLSISGNEKAPPAAIPTVAHL
jgi:hypothetical protein